MDGPAAAGGQEARQEAAAEAVAALLTWLQDECPAEVPAADALQQDLRAAQPRWPCLPVGAGRPLRCRP